MPRTARECMYPAIREWMRKTGNNYSTLAETTQMSNQTIARALNGQKGTSKYTIDKILEATGLTYEAAFSTKKEVNTMTDKERQAAARAAVVGSGDDGEVIQRDVYKHFGYFEDYEHARIGEETMFRYEDDGFPSGQYTTEFDDGPNVLRRMLSILDELRTDRKIRIVIDCDPDFPVAMMRFWGTYKPEIQAKLDAASAELAKRYGPIGGRLQ